MKETGLGEAEAFEESLKETSEQPGWVNAEKNVSMPACVWKWKGWEGTVQGVSRGYK